MNEENVCVGDVFQIGEKGVRVEVTMPITPCYKLNLRFQVKDMALRSQRERRTGWLLRVLEEGEVKVGDRMVLVRLCLRGG
jgi:MOSC domain-containing protein YiiM